MSTATVAEIAKVIRGVSYDKADVTDTPRPDFLPILRAGNIGDNLNTSDDLVWVPAKNVSTEQRIQIGDIAICMSSGSAAIVGKTATSENDWIGSVGAFCALIRANPNKCLPQYLGHYLKSPRFRKWTSESQGANIKNIRKSGLECFEVPLPSISEQRRIVDILSRAEGIVRLRREAEKKAAELIPTLFLDMFGDPATNPKGWRQSTIDESGAAIRYGIGQPLPQIEGGLPFLRATNVKRGVISRTGLVFIDPNANPMKRNPPLKHTDILVVRSGAYTGDIAQVGREFDGAIAGYDLVLSPGSGHLSEFLATYLLLPHVQNGYMAAHKIRAAQPHLNSTQLGNIIVPIPPLNIQSKFVESVNSVRSIQSQQSAATAKAQATFDALLAQVFQG